MRLPEVYNRRVGLYKDGVNELVVKQIGFDKRILDVGCSEGKLGRYLRQHKRAAVFGIDVSDRAIKKAKRNLDGAFVLDIETDRLPFAKKSFDIIICADILEHLYDPLVVLEKLKPYLKDGGIFVLSIPNIANIAVRWNLLWGRFDYRQGGIMDESHIRFFTNKTVRELISRAGLTILKMDHTPGFPFFFLQGRALRFSILRGLLHRLTKLIPTLFCRQFIVVARP
ncbi:class I SAM-dependent methyltransferase [Candidatus Parcubacteria bacterium]|nr:class I SAM-dependent methyltransferase [Candidatus Parcubacteria bacterium]